jgi:hypothetical protein
VSRLDHQQAARREMRGGSGEYAPHQVDAVLTACEREGRLVPVFARQPAHCGGRHVRRIRHDEVVAPAGQRREQVRGDQAHPPPQAVIGHIDPRDLKGVGRDVRGVDQRLRETQRQQHCKTSRSRAQIEGGRDSGGIGIPGREIVAQQLGDKRARNDRAPVDAETVLAEPGFSRQVGRGDPVAHPALEQGEHFARLRSARTVRGDGIELVERLAERVQCEVDRLVVSVGGAVAE